MYMRMEIKKKMLEAGRDDFVTFLAEILNISVPAASRKLSGEANINETDLKLICKRLNFTPDELKTAIESNY